jgi:hypothetical protein
VNLPEDHDQVETKELSQFAHFRAHFFRQIKRPASRETPSGV